MNSRWWVWPAILGGCVALFFAALFVFQRRLIYFPNPEPFAACPNLRGSVPLVFGETRMHVAERGDAWVVVYHGNAGSACDRAYYLSLFDWRTRSYVFPEYAGYAGDGRSPSQAALLKNAADVAAFLEQKQARQVWVIGESLGTAVAVYHASLKPVDRLLLLSPFDSLQNVARSHYPFLPVSWLLRDKFPAASWPAAAGKVLVIHGSSDEVVPRDLGRSLWRSLLSRDKEFLEVPGAGHNDLLDYPAAAAAAKDFLRWP